MPTVEEIKELQKQPTDFSSLDQDAYDNTSQDRFSGDGRLFVKFYKRPMLNQAESVKEGRPIYKEEVCIRIMIPGDKTNIVDRIADEIDVNRFRKQYEHFVANLTQTVGTLLSEVGFIPASLVEELKYYHIETVEQLAGLSDGSAQKIPGIQKYKQKAQAYLDAMSDPEKVLERAKEEARKEIAAELQKRDKELAELRAQIAKVQQRAPQAQPRA